jgi:hypothetical protein
MGGRQEKENAKLPPPTKKIEKPKAQLPAPPRRVARKPIEDDIPF